MQAKYPKQLPSVHWDEVHLNYPVTKFPSTGTSSETIGRRWHCPQHIFESSKKPIEEIKDYFRDYNVTKELTKSQTARDFGFKLPETKRLNKHVSCTENHYIYPPSRKLEEQPLQCSAHGKTETQRSYLIPVIPSRLVTEKDQFKHRDTLILNPVLGEMNIKKDIEFLDTTHEGYEKYLDPYLTTNRLHHRPFTACQLQRKLYSTDVVTYYTLANTPWTRTTPPKTDIWLMPHKRPKSLFDREKFKSDFQEIRTQNKLQFVPGTFRTETRENYALSTSAPTSKIHNDEKEVKSYYRSMTSGLPCNLEQETSSTRNIYLTENALYGSKKPLCSIFNPFTEKSKRLIK